MMVIWRRGNNGKCRGEIFFARATNDAGQKQTGGYAPPKADVWAKKFSPLQWMIGYAKRFAYVWTGIVPRCGIRAHFWFAALDTVRSFT